MGELRVADVSVDVEPGSGSGARQLSPEHCDSGVGRIVAAGDPRVHEAAIKLLNG